MQRFWDKVEKTDDCWLWTGGKRRRGYGTFKYNGKMVAAHRFSYTENRGVIPPGSYVLHTCDTPSCVNPDHLFLGTRADNMADMVTKGRAQRGESRPHAKLADHDVRAIRSAHHDGESQSSIARRYAVSQTSIWKIVHRLRWGHVV